MNIPLPLHLTITIRGSNLVLGHDAHFGTIEREHVYLLTFLQQHVAGTYRRTEEGEYQKLPIPASPTGRDEIFIYDLDPRDHAWLAMLCLVQQKILERDIDFLKKDNGKPLITILLTSPSGYQCKMSISLKKTEGDRDENGTGFVLANLVEIMPREHSRIYADD